ncbi:sigma-70 family RNA polymerase sigma factor [Candidatus Poribacteria bacterium]|nr:sigma-70 family RNA polymerase sigma factor [Candidatus Poribacteria bacterium]
MIEEENDEVLVNRVKEGDLSAFDTLMKKYSKSIYYLALRMTKSHEDAEDISQEVFAKVFKALPTWKPRASFYTWLRTIAVNLCIDYHRTKVRHKTQLIENKDGVAVVDITSDPADSPLRSTEAEELKQKILKAAEKLSSRQREAFMLVTYGGLSLKEASEIMGCAVGTIKAHLNRATAKMRDFLKDVVDEWNIEVKDD